VRPPGRQPDDSDGCRADHRGQRAQGLLRPPTARANQAVLESDLALSGLFYAEGERRCKDRRILAASIRILGAYIQTSQPRAEHEEATDFSPREFFAAEDRVFALGHYAWKIRKTGRAVASDWVHVFTIRGGKIVAFREFNDTAQFAEAYRG